MTGDDKTLETIAEDKPIEGLSEEHTRARYIRHVLNAAYSPTASLDTVMDLITECARTIDGELVHAILFQLQPMTGEILDYVKTKDGQDKGIDFSYVLSCRIDTLIKEKGFAIEYLPPEKRFLSILNGTVVADAYLKRKPVISVNELDSGERSDEFHYGVYDKSRWPHVKQRAAFPIINPLTKQVEYVLVIDNGRDMPLTTDQILDINDFVTLASFALPIKHEEKKKQIYMENVKKGLHDLGSAMNTMKMSIDMAGEYLEKDQEKNPKIVRVSQTLNRQFERFNRLIVQLREGKTIYDLRQENPDDLIQRYVRELKDTYGCITYDMSLDSGKEVLLDTYHFRNALENIIKNSKEAKGNATISISTELIHDEYIRLSIIDDAGGMPPELYALCISKGKCQTTKPDGTGIGIPSILESMRQMGYTAELINHPGKGLEYVFLMPLAGQKDKMKRIIVDF